MRQRLMSWLSSVILLLCLSLNSCNGSAATVDPLDSPETLAAALGQAGAEVRFSEDRGPDVLELTPQSMLVNGEQLWIYHSHESLESSRIRAAFADERFLWANEYIIVQYVGDDGGTILLMEGLLGEALIRPSAAGDEPYPPAVPAAIRLVAQELGVKPAEITVLAYRMEEWEDTCLELGESGEACLLQATPGWIIDLSYDDLEIVVRTDLLGEIVRWRSP